MPKPQPPSYNPEVPLLNVSKRNKNTCPQTTANLYTNVHRSITYNSERTQINYIHTMEYYSTIKGDEVLKHTTTRMNLKMLKLSDKSQSQKTI